MTTQGHMASPPHPAPPQWPLRGEEQGAVGRRDTLETGPGLAALCRCCQEMPREGRRAQRPDTSREALPPMAVTWCVSGPLPRCDMGGENSCPTRSL